MYVNTCLYSSVYLELWVCLGTVPTPTVYGPLPYENHTVTVRTMDSITLDVISVTHQGKIKLQQLIGNLTYLIVCA